MGKQSLSAENPPPTYVNRIYPWSYLLQQLQRAGRVGKIKLPDEILRGEPPASVGPREVHLGRSLPLRSASEPLGGAAQVLATMPRISQKSCCSDRLSELSRNYPPSESFLSLFLTTPSFFVDEDISLTKNPSLIRCPTFQHRLYTQLSPPHPRQSLGGCPCQPNAGFTLPGGHLLRDKGEILLFWGEDKTICMHTIAHRLGGKGTGRKA